MCCGWSVSRCCSFLSPGPSCTPSTPKARFGASLPRTSNELQAEVLILIKGYDDTFSQTVLARHSYRHDEIVWGRRFTPAFYVDGEGELVLELRKVGDLAS